MTLRNTVFFASQAKPSDGITAEKIYGVVTIAIEVDVESSQILDVDCTLSTEVAKTFVIKLLKGYTLEKGVEPLLATLKERYHGDTTKTLGAVIKKLYKQYDEWKLNR